MHPLLRYLLVATPLGAMLFLGLAGFFSGWDGHVVSRRPSPQGEHAVDRVLIVTADGEDTEADWPADVVGPLDLPVDATGVGPNQLPPQAAATHRSRFALHFTVTTPKGTEVVQPPLARPLGIALVAWVLGLVVHNVARSGSPFVWDVRPPAPVEPEEHAPDAPTPPPPPKGGRSKPGPPPSKRRRGLGR